jgi:hypothetical protein
MGDIEPEIPEVGHHRASTTFRKICRADTRSSAEKVALDYGDAAPALRQPTSQRGV